jgi:hypothetical protein
MAAEHLLAQGFRHLVLIARAEGPWLEDFWQG